MSIVYTYLIIIVLWGLFEDFLRFSAIKNLQFTENVSRLLILIVL